MSKNKEKNLPLIDGVGEGQEAHHSNILIGLSKRFQYDCKGIICLLECSQVSTHIALQYTS